MLSEHIKETKLRPDSPYPSHEWEHQEENAKQVKAIMDWQRSLRMTLVKGERNE